MSRPKWSSRPWGWLAVLTIALSLSLSLSLSSAAAPPPAQPSTGQAIPPADAPQNQDQNQPPAPAAEDDVDELVRTEGVDTSQRESEIYGARIDGLQAEVDDLKERIFRSKARLSVLKETVLHGVLAGSRVIIIHRNLMGSQFRLTKIVVILDGAQIYAKTDESGALDQEDELSVYDGNIVPGPHTITVELEYQGQGFGIFSYLNAYTIDPRSSYNFTAPENGALRLMSTGYEKGNISTEMSDRPGIDWQEIPLDASGKPIPQAERPTSKKSKSKSSTKPSSSRPSEPTATTPSQPSKPATTTQPTQKPAPQKPTPQKPGAQKPAAPASGN